MPAGLFIIAFVIALFLLTISAIAIFVLTFVQVVRWFHNTEEKQIAISKAWSSGQEAAPNKNDDALLQPSKNVALRC